MIKPEDLRRITDNTLHGLVADNSLKTKILQKASGQDLVSAGRSFRAVPVLCTVLAVLIVSVLALNTLQPVTSAGPGEIIAFTAGNSEQQSTAIFPPDFKPDSVVRIDLKGIGSVSDPQQCALLSSLLMNHAEYTDDAAGSAEKQLIISTVNGTNYTYGADEPFLTGDDGRIWSCVSFFDEFSKMIK